MTEVEVSPEGRERIRAAHLGAKRSPEARAKMSASAKRRPPVSAETRAKMSAARRNPSTAVRATLSAAQKNRWASVDPEDRKRPPEVQAVVTAALRQPEVRAKLSAAAKARWAREASEGGRSSGAPAHARADG